MLASAGRVLGTIGGGQLEYMGIDGARAFFAGFCQAIAASHPARPRDWPMLRRACNARHRAGWHRWPRRFHTRSNRCVRGQSNRAYLWCRACGRALATALSALPLHLRLIDQRAEELALAAGWINTVLTPVPEAQMDAAKRGDAFVIPTHDHGLDFLLADAALARGDAAYVGMISSATKRARFASWTVRHGANAPMDALACPIGAPPLRDKRPEMIAAFVVPEILAALSLQATCRPRTHT